MTRFDLIGVSIPRSGHHMMVKCLEAIFGDKLAYCKYLHEENCCKQEICARPHEGKVFFRKSHDYDFALSGSISKPRVIYLIQHRKPRGQILSAVELLHKKSARREIVWPADQAQLIRFMAKNALYVRNFHKKWLVNPPKNGKVVAYHDLCADPVEILQGIAEEVGVIFSDATRANVRQAACFSAEPIGVPQRKIFQERKEQESPIISDALMTEYLDIIAFTCGNSFWDHSYGGKEPSGMLYESYLMLLQAADRSKVKADSFSV